MKPLFFCFLGLLLTSCIGLSQAARDKATLEDYNRHFVGLTRDQVIYKHGAPDRTVKLDNNLRYMEYKTRIRTLGDPYLPRQLCSLRLWYIDKYIGRVDFQGDGQACDNFVYFNTRDQLLDARKYRKIK